MASSHKSRFSPLLSNMDQQLRIAFEMEDWAVVDQLFHRLTGLLVDSLIARSGEDVARLGEILGQAYLSLSLGKGLRLKNDGTAAALRARTLDSVATQAIDRIPLPTPEQILAATDDARAKILDHLRFNNSGGPLSNKQLAQRTNLHPGTVARILPVLRSEGLVRSWQAGQSMLNEITARGKSAAGADSPANDAAMFSALEKRTDSEKSTLDMSPPPTPNAPSPEKLMIEEQVSGKMELATQRVRVMTHIRRADKNRGFRPAPLDSPPAPAYLENRNTDKLPQNDLVMGL